MSITFKSEDDIILWTLVKLLHSFRERQYLFVAQYIWWIATLVQLYPALRNFINLRKFPLDIEDVRDAREFIWISVERAIPSTPWDIERLSEPVADKASVRNTYQSDPLRRTQKARVNPWPKTKKFLRAEWKLSLGEENKNGIDQYMYWEYCLISRSDMFSICLVGSESMITICSHCVYDPYLLPIWFNWR